MGPSTYYMVHSRHYSKAQIYTIQLHGPIGCCAGLRLPHPLDTQCFLATLGPTQPCEFPGPRPVLICQFKRAATKHEAPNKRAYNHPEVDILSTPGWQQAVQARSLPLGVEVPLLRFLFSQPLGDCGFVYRIRTVAINVVLRSSSFA